MTDDGASAFLQLIDVERTVGDGSGIDVFIGPPAPERGGRTYGGQLLAQAVAAAYRTVGDERRVHSLHGLFLRAGEVDQPTRWAVERLRDGRSFAARVVAGGQRHREVCRVIASFHTPEGGLEYQPTPDFDMASVPRPDDVASTYVEFCRAHPDFDPGSWFGPDRPMEIRYIEPPDPAGGPPITAPQLTWTRLAGPLPEDPVVHDAGLAYLSDATLIDHALLPHGYRWNDARLTGASLDHAMWFHRAARADRWLLFDQRVESTSGARGLATGRLYGEAGELVATCGQEGLLRWAADAD